MTDSLSSTPARTETIDLGKACALTRGTLSAGERVAGRYEVLRVAGQGGFGVVYEALDRATGDRVAVKVLRPDRWSDAAAERFAREAEVARGLAHPRLARVLRSGSRDGLFYLVMEWTAGVTVEEKLRAGPLPVRAAVEIAAQVAEALVALHGAGLVHRDVKPANVLVDRRGRVKLTDYGLVRRPSAAAGEEGEAEIAEPTGTAESMAPEEVLGHPVDERADLYSLGVLFYEMLAGTPPRRGRSTVGTLLAHLDEAAPDVREARPEVPDRLAALISRLLAREPDERPSSAYAVLTELDRFRGRRLRRPMLAAGLAAVFVALSAFAVSELRPTPRFRAVMARPDALVGIGEGGEILWELPGTRGTLVPARLRAGEPKVLVGDVFPADESFGATPARLAVLDPETGRRLRTIALEAPEEYFSLFSATFGLCALRALDLDADGIDEIVASFCHVPYWPSYTVLFEPRLQRSRIVFYGSGHHRIAGAADLDGDGLRELLLAGINNRFGYSRALAAVRPIPAVDRRGQLGIPARSPDLSLGRGEDASLLWYALLPPGDSEDLRVLDLADPRARMLRFTGPSRRTVRLSYDGFLESSRSAATPEERGCARRRAYQHVREAQRLVMGGWVEPGLGEVARSLAAARRASDPFLREHVERVEGQLLARAGRTEEAEAVFERVIASAPRSTDVPFDAGRAFHLAGDLERAVAWYRRGFGPEGSMTRGRSRWELIEGLVFALDELGRRDEARRTFDVLVGANAVDRGQSFGAVAVYRAYLDWRDGHPPVEELPLRVNDHDVVRYLALELREADGVPASELLPLVDRELERSSDTRPMLGSLRAELLARLDRPRQAAAQARAALDELGRPIDDEVYGRAFRWLVEERAARLGGVAIAGASAQGGA